MSVHPPLPTRQEEPGLTGFEQKYRYVTTLTFLLISISMASLGSIVMLSIMSNTPTSTSPRARASLYTDGKCATPAQRVPYLSTAPAKPLPSEWSKARLTQQDFINAQACAATFVMYYETFDASNLKTLESAVYMLAADAKEHFYQDKGDNENLHMQSTWRTDLQKHRRKQIARVDRPIPQTLQARAGRLLVQMNVPYQLFQQIDNKVQFTSYNDTVQLVGISPIAPQQVTVWQIAGWTGAPDA